MKIKYKYHWWDKPTDEEMELPDDIVFVYVNGDVGQMLHNGYNHYLGCSTSTDEYKEGNGCIIYNNFPDITFFQFDNVIFESEIKIITPEEFYKMFHLDDYYIFKYTTGDIIFLDGLSRYDSHHEIIPPRLVSVSKILEVKSPYIIKTFNCTMSSCIPTSTQEALGINILDNIKLRTLCSDSHNKVEIKRGCDKEFTECVNKVLNKINKKLL